MSIYGAIFLLISSLDLLFTILGMTFGELSEGSLVLEGYYILWGMNGLLIGKILLSGLFLIVMEGAYRFQIIPQPSIKNYYISTNTLYLFLLPILSLACTFLPELKEFILTNFYQP